MYKELDGSIYRVTFCRSFSGHCCELKQLNDNTMAVLSFITTPVPTLQQRWTRRCASRTPGLCGVRMSVEYGRIQHAGVLVRDTEASKKFYMNVLGMADDTELRNPKLPFEGAFVKAGSSQIHLMELPNPDPLDGRPEHGGR